MNATGVLPTSREEVIVLGVGGHAKVVISTLQALGYRVVEAYDDDAAHWGRQLLGVPVVGPLSSIHVSRRRAVLGFGDNRLRRRIAQELPLKWLTAVHPMAIVHASARLGPGTVVFAGAVVQPDARVGEHVIINTGASVDHDCVLEDFSHISPGARLAGSVHIGEGASLGIGSCAIPTVRVGAWATVGAGAVLIRDVPPDAVAVGVPAQTIPRKSQPEYSSRAAQPQNEPVRAEFITPDDARWAEFLKHARHDFYHVPPYVALEAAQNRGQAVAFYAEQGAAKFLMPLVLSPSPFTRGATPAWLDASTPYGYGCPLLLNQDKEDEDALLQNFLEAFRVEGMARNIVTAFVRMHPLLPLPAAPLKKFGQLLRHGQTVYLDLSTPDAEVLPNMMRNHRRDIKKTMGAGFTVAFDQWEHYPRFIEIYRSTMSRRNADEMYFFEGDYFSKLREVLGESLHLATAHSAQGDVVGAVIFVETDGIVQNHLSGTSDDSHLYSPAKILINGVRIWAQEHNCEYFHLGGGVGGREDSLFEFKAGFFPNRADFCTFRIVLDPKKYQQLVERWRQAGGQVVSPFDNYFPFYRRPLPA